MEKCFIIGLHTILKTKIHKKNKHVMTNNQDSKTQLSDTYNQSDSLDACTCGGLYSSTEPIANEFHPTTHKVSLQTSKVIILPKTRASFYSHHLSQYALRETS